MEIPIEHTPLYFARFKLGLRPYDWQGRVMSWFETAPMERVRGTVATPNESGKSSVIIPTLVLWWLAMHLLGKVVVTTKSSLQLESQILPAIRRHAAKFEGWTFNERRILTPTGGEAVFFVTDEAERAEGHHALVDKFTGPVLMIVDEAKSVESEIFDSIDRCGYSALLYTSSPGSMNGRFYDSHYREGLDFKRLRVGLAECPHIDPKKIADIIADHGEDSPFTRSTLHGEFMEADGEARFNREGLDIIKASAEAYEAHWRSQLREHPESSIIGELNTQNNGAITWLPDYETGWLWCAERPRPGCHYIGFGDPMTGIQSEGSAKRDTAAFGILRIGYTDFTVQPPVPYEDEVVAVLHHSEGVRWENDVVAERFAMLCKWFQCIAIVEMNNAGMEVIRLLQLSGVPLWLREKRDHKRPGKKMEVVGFQTTAASKSLWIGALGRGIREQELIVNYLPAAQQFCTFILNEKGTGEAQSGTLDDFCTGVGLALYARASASQYPLPPRPLIPQGYGWSSPGAPQQFSHGACS